MDENHIAGTVVRAHPVGHVLASNLLHQGRGFSWGRGRCSPETVTSTVALSV